MTYEDIVKKNNEIKIYIKNLANSITIREEKEKLLLQAKYKIVEEKGALLLINDLNNVYEFTSLDVLILYIFDKTRYVTNISLLLKYKDVMSTFMLSDAMTSFLMAKLRSLEQINSIEFSRVTDIKVEKSKMVLFKGFVHLTLHDTIVILQKNNKVFVYSDCLLKVRKTSLISFSSLKCTTLKIFNIDVSEVVNMDSMFANCVNLKNIFLENFDTKNATTMSNFFYNCHSLEYIDLSVFNTGNVRDFSNMFWGCKNLTKLDLNSFNMINARKLNAMFKDCVNLIEIDMTNCVSDKKSKLDLQEIFSYCVNLRFVNMTNFFGVLQEKELGYAFFRCSDDLEIRGLERRRC